MISKNLDNIHNQVASVCESVNRDPKEITLVGISKYANVAQIKEAVQSGLVHVGENKVQDAKEKFSLIGKDAKIIKHMVGHLQTNKVKLALNYFDLIESVDSIKLVSEIDKQAGKLDKVVDILAQVNVAHEEQKSGMRVEDVEGFVKMVTSLEHVQLKGLMTIAPLTEDKGDIRRCFSELKEIYDHLKQQYSSYDNVEMKYLSMGMSGDFDIAIEEGSNMIRIGRAIFNG